MLFNIIQFNFVNITLLLFLYIFLLTNSTLNKSMTRMFLLATIIVNILVVADSMDYYYFTLSKVYKMHYFAAATGYTFRLLGPLIIIFSLNRFKPWQYISLTTLFVINMVVAYSSVSTHLMFYYDDANGFNRGPLGFLPFAISGFFLLIMTYQAVQKYRIGNKMEASVVFLVIVMLIVAVCMESFLHYYFLINGVVLVSIVFYYLFMHAQVYKRDAMTHTLNRHSFYADTERFKDIPMTIVSIDINDLKITNDIMGHAEGDKLIRNMTTTIMKHLNNELFLYRMGGDEFILLGLKKIESEMTLLMEHIAEELAENGCQVAWGIAQYVPGMDLNKVMSQSDEKMYARKKQMKEKSAL